MYIVAGLGNPGRKYEKTRHNTGFAVADILSGAWGIPLNAEKHRAICGKGVVDGKQVLLVKPQTYMNLSGESLQEILAYYKADPETDLIVISDDIALEPGRIRVREKGSAGGHNGLKNIIARLGTQGFARVRVGVGEKPPGWDLVDWVTGRFSPEEEELMAPARRRAAEAVECILKEGTAAAMNLYNRSAAQEG